MAPRTRQATPSAAPSAPTPSTPAAPSPSKNQPATRESSSKQGQAWPAVLDNLFSYYVRTTPQRTKLIDVFLAFLVVVGALQFLYCVVAGNYPFNAFLAGFSATVGQFVLTASLRIQTAAANKEEFPSVSPERAFADFVVGSMILHFFCINFIN